MVPPTPQSWEKTGTTAKTDDKDKTKIGAETSKGDTASGSASHPGNAPAANADQNAAGTSAAAAGAKDQNASDKTASEPTLAAVISSAEVPQTPASSSPDVGSQLVEVRTEPSEVICMNCHDKKHPTLCTKISKVF